MKPSPKSLLDAYLSSFRGLPSEAWWLALVLFANRCGTMVLPFWALFCRDDLGFTVTQTGGLLSLFGVGSLVGAMLGGWLTMRVGSLRVQWISLFGSGFGLLALLRLHGYLQVATGFVGLAIIMEMMRPAVSTATANMCPPELHPRAMALNRLAVNLGMSVGPVLGGFLADRNFELLFWCDGVTCILAGVLFLSRFGLRAEVESIHSSVPSSRNRKSVFSPWLNPNFAWFGLFNFLSVMVFFQLLCTYMLYLEEHYGLSKSRIGLLLSINTIMIVVLEMALIRFVESMNKLRVVAVGFLFSGVGFCVLPFGAGIGWAMVSVVLWTIGEMLSMPLGSAYVAGQSGPEERGSYMGAFSMSYAAAFIVAPMVGMWAYEMNPNYVWYGGFVITLIASGGTLVLSSRAHESAVE